MTPRTDVTALIAGLLALALASLGLWTAFGTPAWPLIAKATPALLIVIGVIGVIASRRT